MKQQKKSREKGRSKYALKCNGNRQMYGIQRAINKNVSTDTKK
jgi:hypothetical protein